MGKIKNLLIEHGNGVFQKRNIAKPSKSGSGLYLFTQPDIPWVPDPGQRASPEERLRSHALLIAEAEIHALNIVPIHGNQDERYLAMD